MTECRPTSKAFNINVKELEEALNKEPLYILGGALLKYGNWNPETKAYPTSFELGAAKSVQGLMPMLYTLKGAKTSLTKYNRGVDGDRPYGNTIRRRDSPLRMFRVELRIIEEIIL